MRYDIYKRYLPLAPNNTYRFEPVCFRTNKRDALSCARELSSNHPEFKFSVHIGAKIIAFAKAGRVSHFAQY